MDKPQIKKKLDKGFKIITRNNNYSESKLGKYFRVKDFMCNCGSCDHNVISIDLIDKLNRLRHKIGRPIYVTSAYRCKDHNNLIGGKSQSKHLIGIAADITVVDRQLYDKLVKEASRLFNGIGVYKDKNFLHVDIRKKKARWQG